MTNGEAERYLIVSLGSIGRRHLHNLKQIRPHAEIGVLHLRTSAVRTETPDGGVQHFDSIQQALEFGPAAAIVAGPASTHLSVARKLADVGIHLLVEKPLAAKIEGCAELVLAARRSGLVVMIGYNLPFLPSLRLAKECVDSGMIGRVLAVRAEVGQYLPDWRPGADYRGGVSAQGILGGGALLELSHELHYLYWMFGMPSRVSARGGKYSDLEIDVEDMVEITLEFESPRRLANVHLDMVQRTPHRMCRFIGSEGTLVWDAILDRLDIYRASSRTWESVPVQVLSDRNQMYVDELAHFLDCIEKGTRPIVDGTDGLNTLALIAAARHSMACGENVEVTAHAR